MADPCEALNFLTLTAPQQAAAARLLEVVRRGGVAVLCGPAGTGKSMLLRRLAGELQQQQTIPCSVPSGVAQAAEFLRTAHQDAAVRGRQPLALLVDDADAAPNATTLADLVSQMPAAGGLVLAGEGRLLTLLARQPVVEQRISLRAVLRPWSDTESRDLIAARLPSLLALANASELCQRMHELTAGIPRLLVRLIETVAMVLAASDRQQLSVDDLETFHRRLFLAAA